MYVNGAVLKDVEECIMQRIFNITENLGYIRLDRTVLFTEIWATLGCDGNVLNIKLVITEKGKTWQMTSQTVQQQHL